MSLYAPVRGVKNGKRFWSPQKKIFWKVERVAGVGARVEVRATGEEEVVDEVGGRRCGEAARRRMDRTWRAEGAAGVRTSAKSSMRAAFSIERVSICHEVEGRCEAACAGRRKAKCRVAGAHHSEPMRRSERKVYIQSQSRKR